MAQESIPADSKKWDGKKIVLTDTTKKNVMKKAYVLDAESLLSQQGGIGNYQGDDAVKAVEERGMTQEQLIQTPQTYSNLAYEAILALEANEGKEQRVAAIRAFQELSYTNIYDSTTQDFLTPPANKDEEAKVEAQKEVPAGPKSNPYYNRGAKVDSRVEAAKQQAKAQSAAIREQNERVRQQQSYEQQVSAREETIQQTQYVQSPKSNNFLSTLMPNVGRKVVQRTEVRNMGRGPMTNPNIGRVSVRPYVGRPQSNVQSAPAERGPAPVSRPQMVRPSLNPATAAKFGSVGLGRKNVVGTNPGMGMGGMRSNILGRLSPKKK
jgi:hypothetical protein